MKRRSKRRRRSLTILSGGGLGWGLLVLMGLAGPWTTLLILCVTIGLLVLNGASRERRPRPYVVLAEPLGEPEEQDPVENPLARPNAVSEEYNAFPEPRNSPPPTSGHRGRSLPQSQAADDGSDKTSRLPPPVPPPLFGRPGSRFLLAGDTPRRPEETAAAEVAAGAAAGLAVLADARPAGIALAEVEAADARDADAGDACADPAETENTDAQHEDAEPEDAEPTDAEPTDTEPTDTEPTDTEPTTRETVDAQSTGADDVDTEFGDAATVEEESAYTQTVDADTADTETLDTETLDAETANAETANAETANAETANAETVNAEAADARTVATATVGTETANTTAMDTEAAAVEIMAAEGVDAKAVDPGRQDPENVDSETEDAEEGDAQAYQLPTFDMLPLPPAGRTITDDEILERASLLERTLRSFGVEARVVDFSLGPAVTRYELQPGPGVRVNKFTALVDDLALALAAEDVRIEAPIPGKSAVGIEVPNKERMPVPLREVLESPQFRGSRFKLPVAFGKDSAGKPVVGDLARMPHLLIAGSTGSGKSVCMNSIICSLLFKARPDEVKMLMIDPKVVELSTYNGIPHLAAPVITDARRAAGYLKGAVKEMEARYELFAAAGVRNIEQYNQTRPKPLPYVVIFIDELADLMMVAPADVEDSICRLAQMARACGMHLVIATQSPRVDVITGLIKANVPSRIAFAVSSQVDSRVILDSAGAERLLGRGDMLYHPSGLPKPVRAQGAFIDEEAVDRLVRFVKAQGQPVYTAEEVEVETGPRRGGRSPGEEGAPASSLDAVLPMAARIVIEHGQASVSILQRRLRCNYTKATRLIDLLEERGFIGPHQGSKPRDVLISMAEWQALFGKKEPS